MKQEYKRPITRTRLSITASLLCGSSTSGGDTSEARPTLPQIESSTTPGVTNVEYAGECCSRVRFQF